MPQMLSASILATLRGMSGDSPVFEPKISADERADVREPQDMPADVITMNSRARFLEEGTALRLLLVLN